MRPNPDGSFEISPKEKVTVTVKKSLRPYLASFSDLDCTNWDSKTKPDELTEVRTFIGPEKVCSWCKFVIFFDFLKDGQGKYDPNDKYTVVITGENDPPAQDIIHPPPPKDHTYRFHVSNP
jgi:hypothetical protein